MFKIIYLDFFWNPQISVGCLHNSSIQSHPYWRRTRLSEFWQHLPVGLFPYHRKLNECRRVIIQLPLIETSSKSSRIFSCSPKKQNIMFSGDVEACCWGDGNLPNVSHQLSLRLNSNLWLLGTGQSQKMNNNYGVISGVLGARHVDDDDDDRSWTLCWPISKAVHLHLHLEDQTPLESIML